MSKNYTGYVFGHYDSRGGTMMIIANDYNEALRHYEDLFGITAEELEDYGAEGSGLDEDFLGEAILEGISDPSIFDKDLEDTGRVLQLGEFEDVGKGIDNTIKTGPVRLLYQPIPPDVDVESMPMPDGFWQPSWNDDAYGFCVSVAESVNVEESDAEAIAR